MTASDEIAALAEALMYCPDTGALTWRRTVSARAVMGGVVGWRNRKGHLVFTFNRKRYRVHRVAFALIWGRWPAQQIDHKNGDPADNRWSNLREVDNATNCQNRHKAKCRAGLIGAGRAHSGGLRGAEDPLHHHRLCRPAYF